MVRRRSLDETWHRLESQGEEMPRNSDGQPFVPPQMPNYEDEELGFSFLAAGDRRRTTATLPCPEPISGTQRSLG